ncbi:hypothetical protein, conserved [Eimeria praecox]|uniref:Uncharacterized protein n=1 Tax=Eimeria praecox TaxID=51316 RepID=U6G6U1_9EIME|nr:hypothetical protein, conserved [Eimeria praecox]
MMDPTNGSSDPAGHHTPSIPVQGKETPNEILTVEGTHADQPVADGRHLPSAHLPNGSSDPAGHHTPSIPVQGKETPNELLTVEGTHADQPVAGGRHLPSAHLPSSFNTSTEGPVVGTIGDEQLRSVLTTPDEFKQKAQRDREGEANWETHASAEYLDDIVQLKKLDLRPCAFTSLADAFHASLCVVRCLRGMLRLQSGCADIGYTGQNPQNNESPQRFHAGSCSVAADVLSHQESFVADEAAYDHLLTQPSYASQKLSHAPSQLVSEDGSTATQKGLPNPVLQGAAAYISPGRQTVTPSSCSGLTQGGKLKHLPEPPVVRGMHSACHEPTTGAQTQGKLEYELSVCKALMLLQLLSTNSASAVEESPSVSTPQSVAPQNAAGRAALYSAYNATEKTNDFMKISDSSCRGFQALILEILLRVRLLQGKQQLVRADFTRLLHQQQKQQQQLLKAVQTTVMKLGQRATAF